MPSIAHLAGAVLAAAALPATLASLHARQATVGGDAASSTVTSAPAPSASVPAATSAAGTVPVTTPAPAPATDISISLHSTNPTAFPLSSIIAGQPSQPTTTYPAPTAGATPTYMKGAPGLPDLTTIHPSNYPALDVIPPTDSPEVAAWKQEVANSGISIPSFAPTVEGGCPANPGAINDGRCWWTCGGCTRDGIDITTCPDKYTWGMTYDDGPAYYTPNLLDYLDSQQLKTTFFAVGSRVISFPALLQAEYMAGHQIAVHTWSHHSMTMMTDDQIIAELGWSRKVIKDVLGVTPNMWRPPFGDIDDRVRNISIAMGLTPVMWTRISPLATFDTGDFNINGGTVTAPQVLANWENIMGNASAIDTGFIVLEHDLFEQCVELATGYIIPDAVARTPKLNIKPVAQCLNKPMEYAYVETNDNKTNPPPQSAGAAAAATLTGSAAAAASGSAKPSGSSSGDSSAATALLVPGLATALVGAVAAVLAL